MIFLKNQADSIAEVERQLLVRLWRLRALVPERNSGKLRASPGSNSRLRVAESAAPPSEPPQG